MKATPLTLVINLDKSQQRMNRISSRLNELEMPFERVPAVYGASLSAAERGAFYSHALNEKSYRRPLSNAEIGCYMSHLKAWQTIVDRELPCALVIEDDLVVDSELKEFVHKLSASTADWDMVKFYCRKSNPKITAQVPIGRHHHLCRFQKVPIGNLAQLITLEAAKKLLATRKNFGRPVDDDIQHWWESDLNVLGVFPSVVHVIKNAQSDIDKQGARKSKSQRLSLWRTITLRASYEYNLRTRKQKIPLPTLVE
jgi:glycosyl transferase, family 25